MANFVFKFEEQSDLASAARLDLFSGFLWYWISLRAWDLEALERVGGMLSYICSMLIRKRCYPTSTREYYCMNISGGGDNHILAN